MHGVHVRQESPVSTFLLLPLGFMHTHTHSNWGVEFLPVGSREQVPSVFSDLEVSVLTHIYCFKHKQAFALSQVAKDGRTSMCVYVFIVYI